MKITLKLFAGFADYLPPDADGNAVTIDAPAPLTPRQLINRYRLPPEQVRVVMRNGEFVPAEARDAPLGDGDVVAVWPSVQGG
ncbi:MAG: MoaD/ThiS family protein [Gammaproteobacteria bacterium]|nr:MoaD/ThiS family protein [Gammaproteobacteria bacterium]MDD9821323.1 MoaD/ThiS family protein [Gammaproteobacteria bacterium]